MYLLMNERLVYKEPTNGRYYAVRIIYTDKREPVLEPDYKHEVKRKKVQENKEKSISWKIFR